MKAYVKYSLFGLMIAGMASSSPSWASNDTTVADTAPVANTTSADPNVEAVVVNNAPAAGGGMEEVNEALLTAQNIINLKEFLLALKDFKKAMEENNGVGGRAVESQLMHEAFKQHGLVDESLTLAGDLTVLVNKIVQSVDADEGSGCQKCQASCMKLTVGTSNALNIIKQMLPMVDKYYTLFTTIEAKEGGAKPEDYIAAFLEAKMLTDLHKLLDMAINFKTEDNKKRLAARASVQRKAARAALVQERKAARQANKTSTPVVLPAKAEEEVKK